MPGGFRLRNTASERVWDTAHAARRTFYAHAVPLDTPVHRARERQLDQVVFTLLTTRSHDQYNTTIYGQDDRYRGVFGQRRVVFINPADIRHLGLRDGDWVDIHTVWSDGVERRADRFKLVAYDIPRGNLAAYYPETNPLVPLSSTADRGRHADVEVDSRHTHASRGRGIHPARRHDVRGRLSDAGPPGRASRRARRVTMDGDDDAPAARRAAGRDPARAGRGAGRRRHVAAAPGQAPRASARAC